MINSARSLSYVYVNVYKEGGVGPGTGDVLVSYHKILLKHAVLSHIINCASRVKVCSRFSSWEPQNAKLFHTRLLPGTLEFEINH